MNDLPPGKPITKEWVQKVLNSDKSIPEKMMIKILYDDLYKSEVEELLKPKDNDDDN